MIRIIANIIWFICGGFITAILWFLLGLLLCISIVGIPLGIQCFKAAKLSFFPYGKKVETNFDKHRIANTVWAILAGWWIALIYIILAVVNFITIIGIPKGLRCLKFVKLAFFPFGAEIINPNKKKKR